MMNPSSKKSIPISTNDRGSFLSLRNELDKFINGFADWSDTFNFPKMHFENLSLSPSIDLVDDKDQFKVEVEMPGMGEEDIKVSINNGILTIKGEKTVSKEDNAKNYTRREIHYGTYERSLSLPDTIDIDKAKASFKKGMLWVTIPKKPEYSKGSKEIQVEKVK